MEISFDVGPSTGAMDVDPGSQAQPIAISAGIGIGVGMPYDDPAQITYDAMRGNQLRSTIEEQVILRVPPAMARQLRAHCRGESAAKGEPPVESMKFQMRNTSKASFKVNSTQCTATLVDLPSVIETHRTYNDGKTMFKSADVAQMFVVNEEGDKTMMTVAHASGITPYTQHIKKHYARLNRDLYVENSEIVLHNIQENIATSRFELGFEEIEVEMDEEEWEEEQKARRQALQAEKAQQQAKKTSKPSTIKKKKRKKPKPKPATPSTLSSTSSSSLNSSILHAPSPSPQFLSAPSPAMADPLAESVTSNSFTVTLSAIPPSPAPSSSSAAASASSAHVTFPPPGREARLPGSSSFPSASPEVQTSLGSQDAVMLVGFPSAPRPESLIAAASPPEPDMQRQASSSPLALPPAQGVRRAMDVFQAPSQPQPSPTSLADTQPQPEAPQTAPSPTSALEQKLADLRAQHARGNKIIQKRLQRQITKLEAELAALQNP